MFEADDEADSDSSSASSSSSSSEEDSDGEPENTTQNPQVEVEAKNNSLEDDLLSEVYMPTPPPPQMIASIDEDLDLKPSRPLTPVPWAARSNPSAEAVIKSS